MSEPQFCGCDRNNDPIYIGGIYRTLSEPLRLGRVIGAVSGPDWTWTELEQLSPDPGPDGLMFWRKKRLTFKVEDIDLLPATLLDLLAAGSV